MILTHIVGNSKWLKKEHVLQVEMQKGSYIPYFITQCKAANDKEYIVNVEDIEMVESAKKLVSRQVYVDEAILRGYEKQSPLLWIGFRIIDKQSGDLGPIDDILQTGNQWLAKLNYKNTEVLLPLIEQTIDSLDIKSKTINMTLPDGLLEVYLG